MARTRSWSRPTRGQARDEAVEVVPGDVDGLSVQGAPREKETPLGDEPEGRLARAIW